MSVYVTRHGETDWNVQNKVMGKIDIELNDKGRIQAENTRDELSDIIIDFIISSPLLRAKETANIINRDKNLEIIFDDSFSERDFGEFEGLKREEFDFSNYWSYKANISYEKAENIRIFFKRVYSALDKIKIKYHEKNILIVAHGGISIPIYCYFNGVPKDDNLLVHVLHNCEVKKYDF